MRTIAIINQKGGCGKTTTAINLAAAMAERNLRTLLIDLDPQSHCAAGLAAPETKFDLDVSDALLAGAERRIDPARLIWRIGRNLDLIPSRTKLAGLEAAGGGLFGVEHPERRLLLMLDAIGAPGRHDVCIIDCPPSIGLLTYNALAASREVLIPVETSYFSLLGAQKQQRTVRSVGRKLGLRHAVRLLPTIHDATRPLARDLLAELQRQFGEAVAPVTIRLDTRLPEAASFGRPIFEYAPDSPGAEDYRALAGFVLSTVPPPALLDDHPIEDDAEPDDLPEVTVVRATAARATAPAPSRAAPPTPSPIPSPIPSPASATTSAAAVAAPLSRAADVSSRTMTLHERDGSAARFHVRAVSGPLRLIEEIREEVAAGGSTAGKLFGARSVAGRILFVQPIAAGRRVHVAGTFNDWNPLSHPMRRNEDLGVHELALDLPPGTYEYRLVVDGRWIDDPHAAQTSANSYGGRNAVVRVEPT